eukprot:gene10212-9032_t
MKASALHPPFDVAMRRLARLVNSPTSLCRMVCTDGLTYRTHVTYTLEGLG